MSGPSLDDFRARLSGVRSDGNGGLMALCPCHDDHSPSLHVWIDQKGVVAFSCMAGCPWPDVKAQLIEHGLDIGGHDGDEELWTPCGPAAAEYRYQRERGRLSFVVCRTAEKQFPCWHPDSAMPHGKAWNMKGVRRVLFRLPELLVGVAAGATIYVAEGEKDVEALVRADAVATCNPGGAGKWRAEYNCHFSGATVIVVTDKDEPGRKHAEQVRDNLGPIAASVSIVEAAEGKDAADHLAAGYGLEEFVSVTAAEPMPEAADGEGAPTDDQGDPLVHEAAHAEVLKAEWRGLYRWSEHEGTWRHWTRHVWKKVAEPVVVAAAHEVLRQHYGQLLMEKQTAAEDARLHALYKASCRHKSVRDGLAFLKGADGFYTAPEQWDADLDKLNCADGLLDLNTRVLGDHDPEALCTMMTRWSYDDESTTGAWEKQLELGLPNPNIRRQVQRDLGRALSGAVKEHSLPIWYGTGRNTKTTDAEALLYGLGEYAAMAVANLLMASKYERHKTEIAELSGKRLVFSDEVDENKELAEARVKDLTGGGRTMRANFMHRDNFDVKKTFTIFLMVTHLPTISGTDKGIWDRIREVPWTVSIPFGEQRAQDDVVAELDADGSWMLHWIVAGYADFQAEPRWIAEEVRAATDFYHIEQDRLLGFITDACEEKPFVHEAKGSLYGAYASWCSANDEQPLSNIDFGKALKTRGIKEKRVGHDKTRVWIGIRLCAGSSAEMRPSAAGSSSNPPSNSSREQSPDAAAASGRNAGQKVP